MYLNVYIFSVFPSLMFPFNSVCKIHIDKVRCLLSSYLVHSVNVFEFHELVPYSLSLYISRMVSLIWKMVMRKTKKQMAREVQGIYSSPPTRELGQKDLNLQSFQACNLINFYITKSIASCVGHMKL